MKHPTKSNMINYTQIYNTLTLAITCFLLYIGINFFLPFANFLSFLGLAIGSFFLIVYLFSKQRFHLMTALVSTILSIALSLAFIYQ